MDVFGGAPRFLAYPRTFTVPSGADAVLKCQIAGDPRPTVIWERDQTRISPSDRYHFVEEGDEYNLVVRRALLEDSGQYICKAKNPVGETYAAATLRVEEGEWDSENRPVFLVRPSSARVGRGDDVVFMGQLAGKPAPSVCWEKDGKKLSEIFESAHFSAGGQGEGWHHLKLFGARPPDAGVYLCRASNTYGEAMAAAVLLVDPATEALTPTLSSSSRQPSTPGLQNGEGQEGHRPHRERRHRGRPQERRAEPGLGRGPAGAGDQPHPAKVRAFAVSQGKHAKFRCLVTGKPKPEIVWRKDGRLVTPDRRHLLYEDREGYFNLKVLYCKQWDRGLYTCAASNAAGQTLSSVLLHIKEPRIKFRSQLQDVEVKEREQAVLECEVPAESVPATWYLEDRQLQPSAKYVIEQWGTLRRLTIRDITMDDDGVYLCQMKDGGRSIAEVAVKGKIVKRLPRKLDVVEGENAAFCVDLDEDNVDVRWYKDGELLSESHKTIIKSFGKTHILVFVNATLEDAGVITFVISESKSSSQLRVKPKRQTVPGAPENARMSCERSNTASLVWSPPAERGGTGATGFVVERQELGSEEWVRCLTTEESTAVEILGESVPAEARYRFRVCAVNKHGRGGVTEFPGALHLVPVARIRTHLNDATVCQEEDVEFAIELTAPVIGTWHMRGRQLQEGERISIQQSRSQHSLLIRRAKLEENEVEVTFVAHGVRDSAILFVKAVPLKVSLSPGMEKEQRVTALEPIVLSCELSRPSGQVRWVKDGQDLEASDRISLESCGQTRRLIVQSSQLSDSGQYTCDATDDSITFCVTVSEPPVRIVNTVDDTKAEYLKSDRIVLNCEVSRPSAEVRWYKNGLEVEGDTNITMMSHGVHRSLIIQSARIEDSGEYVCDAGDDSIFFNITVREPRATLRVAEDGHQTRYLCGETVVLNCEASHSDAEVKWYKDSGGLEERPGVRMESEGVQRRLVIPHCSKNDSGVYVCEATGDSLSFTVTVTDHPVTIVSSSPSEVMVPVGAEVILWCQLSWPQGLVRWSRDGAELEPSERCRIEVEEARRRLTIHPAMVEDQGTYVCRSADAVAVFKVMVSEPRVTLRAAEDGHQTRYLCGETVVLNCEASHSDAEVKWYKDSGGLEERPGVRMESEGVQRRLVIPHCSKNDSGVYVCEATGDSLSFTVTVTEPSVCIIRSTDQLLDHKFLVSEEIHLECEVSRADAFAYWYKDGEKIAEDKRMSTRSEGTVRSLQVLDARLTDSGEYLCDVQDDSIVFRVLVEEPPVRITRPTDRLLVHKFLVSEKIRLECEASRANALARWYKNGEKVAEDRRMSTRSEGTVRSLQVLDAQLTDSGEYLCDVQDDSIVFRVLVEEPPVRITRPTDRLLVHKFLVSENICLECEASRANALARWYKNGKKVAEDRRTSTRSEGTVRSLQVLDAQLTDSGEYLCDVQDDSIVFQVLVEEPPVRITRPTDRLLVHKFLVSENICLECEASRANALAQWFKNGEKVAEDRRMSTRSEGTVRSLQVLDAQLTDSGEYLCDVQDDSIVFRVLVEEPPVRITRPTDRLLVHKFLVSEKIRLECEASRANALARWFKNGEKVAEDRRMSTRSEGTVRSLQVLDAQLTDSGEYLCDVQDDSIVFRVLVEEPPVRIIRPTDRLLDHKILVSQEIHLECEVSRANALARWYKDREKVAEDGRTFTRSEGAVRSLRIQGARLTDSGKYLCDVRDDSIVFRVHVEEPPVRITQPTGRLLDCRFLVSEEIRLECEVSRADALARWYKDGERLAEDRRTSTRSEGVVRSLRVQGARLTDSGEYLCDVQGDSIVFQVLVEEPPVRITRPTDRLQDHKFLVSQEIRLECEVSRADALAQWYKGGEKVAEDGRTFTRSEGTVRSLQVLGAQLTDSGEYLCDVRDDGIVFRVLVEVPPVRITRPTEWLMDHKFLVSEEIRLECELSRADALARWYKDGEKVAEDGRTSTRSEGTVRSLQVLDAQLTDSGEYLCDVQDDSIVFRVLVEDPPVTILGSNKVSEDRTFTESEVISMMCKLSRSDVKVRWYRDGVELLNSDKVKIESRGLTRELMIFDSEPRDSGQYVCDAGTDKLTFKVTVAEAPVLFTNKGKLPEEVTVNENGKAVLAAIVSKEKGSVTWYRHKEPVSAGEKNEMSCESRVHSLILKNVQKEDSGFYVCRSADDEMTFNVNVIELPLVFVRRLENTGVQRGSSVTLWCELSKARGDVAWLKDGAEVEPSRRRVIRAEGRLRSLTLSKAAPEDEGEYACESKDDRTAARVSVTVPRVVEFISDLHNLTVLEGEAAKFKCMVSPEDVQLVWRVNGANVPPGSGKYLVSQNGLCHTLLIRDCRAGEVTRVTAEAEGIFSKAILQVQEAQIMFTKKMVSVAVEELQDATFEVEVSCEAAEVQWMKQGLLIQAGPRFLLQSEGRLRRLTVLGATVGDRGTYRCETLHDRTLGKLSVEPRRISLRKSLVDLDTFEKEAATFHVELSHPDVEGVWIKDGIRVKPCSKRRVSVEGTQHSLTLSDLTLEDTGTIAFQSNNIRCSARLTVREPPVTFTRQLKDLQVPETTAVTLECELSRPNVEVRWYKDDMEIKPSKSIRIYSMGRKRVMQLGRCRVEDSGIYSCDAGDNKTTAKLEVYEREVRIVKHLEDLEVRENDNAVFVCEVSHEGVKGEWLKDGERIKSNNTVKIRQEGTKHFLLICKVKAEDAGEIRFTAKNVESTAHLDINELPIKIVKPLRDKTALEKHKVILECKVSKPRARVRWYRGDEELQPTDKYEICSEDCYRKLVIHNVSFEDEDTYTCDAFDDISSAKVLVEEQAILMVKDLEDVEVRAPGRAEMECEVSVPVIRPPQWTLSGQLLQNGKEVRLENRGTVQRLILSQTSPEMSGLVKFTAGKARSSARLTVKAE
ncbi:obscurin-like protein 1a isoform X1 [Mobula birostris]|uniref:obscurin-like protein 1a isoform X1 n=1 Tax=Mobula birostris TaxID=1983395 RepID=UPI003B28257B